MIWELWARGGVKCIALGNCNLHDARLIKSILFERDRKQYGRVASRVEDGKIAQK